MQLSTHLPPFETASTTEYRRQVSGAPSLRGPITAEHCPPHRRQGNPGGPTQQAGPTPEPMPGMPATGASPRLKTFASARKGRSIQSLLTTDRPRCHRARSSRASSRGPVKCSCVAISDITSLSGARRVGHHRVGGQVLLRLGIGDLGHFRPIHASGEAVLCGRVHCERLREPHQLTSPRT